MKNSRFSRGPVASMTNLEFLAPQKIHSMSVELKNLSAFAEQIGACDS
jgi:hypothetical protein